MSENPYDILGVKPDASQQEIKAAYRKLAKSLHPDLNPGDKQAESRFKSVSSAFNFLKDEEQRARFDRGEIDATGAEQQQPFYRSYADAGPRHRYYNTSGFSDLGDESDIFSAFFGQTRDQGFGQRSAHRARQNLNVHYSLDVDFLDAARGTKRRVTMPDGTFLDVTVPPGISNGNSLRLKGKGLTDPEGGPRGDAYVKVRILPHSYFVRQGDDIHLEMPITIDEAILGGKITVPTIHGDVVMPVPEGANSGQILRLRGKGIKKQGNTKAGDQLLTLKIVMPEQIDDDLKTFAQGWRKKHAYKVRKKFDGGTT